MISLSIVNFHYVGDPADIPYPGRHPISPKTFASLIDDLAERFHIASPDEVSGFARCETVFDRDACFLTFDDGLKEHASIVRTLLNARGLKGAFFVPSRPLADRRPLCVNATHWLRSTTPPREFQEELFRHLTTEERIALPSYQETANTIYRYDSGEVALVKYVLTYLLPEDRVERIVDEFLDQRNMPAEELVDELYMSAGEITELARDGHEIGLHGRNHRPMSSLDEQGLDGDIRHCAETLENLCGIHARWLAYPYGNADANPANPEALLKRHGLEIGFTLTKQVNAGTASCHELSRLNPNDLAIHGEAAQ